MIYLCNTFTPHMFPRMAVDEEHMIRIRRIDGWEAEEILKSDAFRSFYGHGSSAEHLARYLHVDVPVSRGYVVFRPGDVVIVAAITGKREWEAGRKPYPGWVFFEVAYGDAEH